MNFSSTWISFDRLYCDFIWDDISQRGCLTLQSLQNLSLKYFLQVNRCTPVLEAHQQLNIDLLQTWRNQHIVTIMFKMYDMIWCQIGSCKNFIMLVNITLQGTASAIIMLYPNVTLICEKGVLLLVVQIYGILFQMLLNQPRVCRPWKWVSESCGALMAI